VASPAAAIVVGIGLNLTLTEDELPVPTATSLLLLDSPVLDRTLVLTALLQSLSTRIGAWQAAHGPDAALIEDYRRCSATFGERVRAELPGGGDVVGRAVDLDDAGRLLIDVGAQTVAVSAGDITHLRLADG
jgi:BirA family biotin operon repressor/biotin-[acetyl-CoA-carboxylase] ligase